MPTADFVREHLQALHTGSKLTRWFRKDREPNVLDVTPENVIAALNRAGINPVLMGAHGINVYRHEARSTDDVDVLVTKKEVRKTIRILDEAFPYLEITENAAVARFSNPVTQKVVLDVMKPASRAIQLVFRNSIEIQGAYRIPTLEMAIVSKYVAMTSPTRRFRKRHLDIADFMEIVEYNRAKIDVEKLKRLAESAQRGGGNHIVELIGEIDAGRDIH